MSAIKIIEADHEILIKVKELLASENLPNKDINENITYFLSAVNSVSNELIGAVGLEIYGTEGLFRSLVVKQANRSKGIGKMLHNAILSHALVHGLRSLYLLTTTANVFFEKAGWGRIDRREAPEDVQNTTEFSSICPSTAVCMRLALAYDKKDEAEKIFRFGFNCAQSVFLPFTRKNNIAPELALKLATGFGAGMVNRGETCGAVTGAMMAIGLAHGRSVASDSDSRDNTYALINRFYDEFKRINGSIICKELLQVDISSEEGKLQAGKEGLFQSLCPKFVRDAAEITEKILND